MGACSPVEAGMKGQKENRKAQKNRCIHLHLYFFVTSTTDCFVSDEIFTKTEMFWTIFKRTNRILPAHTLSTG